MKTAELIDAYLAWHVTEVVRSTHQNARYYLGRFAELFGNIPATELRAYMLTEFIRLHPSWGQWGKFHASTTICAMTNWAVRQQHLTRNPFANVKERPGENRRAATEEEFAALVKNVPHPPQGDGANFRRVCYALRWLGCRVGELCVLRWSEHVDLDDRLITWRHHKTRRKTGRARTVPLEGKALRMFLWMKARATNDHVFVNAKGKPFRVNAVRLRFCRLRDKLGLPKDLVPYCVRHQFVTSALGAGVDVFAVSQIVGHSDLRMTQRYCHHPTEHLRAAMRRAAGG